MKSKNLFSVVGISLLVLTLLISSTAAETNTLYTDEITLAYDMQRSQFRYWYIDSTERHTLIFTEIQEQDNNAIRETLIIRTDTADIFEVSQGYQNLTYHIDNISQGIRTNVYLYVEITFNEIYFHFWIGTWDLESEGNTLRVAYILDQSETKYLSFDENNKSTSLKITVDQSETTIYSFSFDPSQIWTWISRINNLFTVVVSTIAIILGIKLIRRKNGGHN